MKKPIEISLCMIVKNEEKNLENCMNSFAGVFDEINIVDTGSADRTIEIAKKYTDRIFHFEWIHDFAAARNFSFSKATKEYVMWLDADDIILGENKEKLLRLKKSITHNIDYVVMPYNCTHDENGNPLLVTKRERIVKRARNFQWCDTVHEYMPVDGNSFYAEIPIKHNHKVDKGVHDIKMARNFDILKKKLAKCGALSSKDMYYYAASLCDLEKYEEAIIWFKKFLDEFSENGYPRVTTYTTLHKCYTALGDYENAARCMLEVEPIYSDMSEFHCCLGDFFKDTVKDYETAIKYYNKATACAVPVAKDFIYMEFYYSIPYKSLGKAYLDLKDYKKSLFNYKEALKYSTKDEETSELVMKLEKLTALLY